MKENELNVENNEDNEQKMDFIRTIIADDLKMNKITGEVVTRFPPEPNGYLHIGHAKSICLNFGISLEGENRRCHLRFDDTNPIKEETEYIDSIQEDVKWLGFDWGENLFYASDYYGKLYERAVELIKAGKAFICSLNSEQMREYRGTLTNPGKNSPDRDRTRDENLELFEKMKNGGFEEGEYTLRAKIDMASPNMNMRDPAVYRILKTTHHRTGDQWCIYPMYDFAHCLSDSFEGITHSLCTLEFEDHRPLYNWFLDNITIGSHPQQIEFARLELTYTVLSKRKLLKLVDQKIVNGWDDPRMPTISGFRRRGYTPESIKTFCNKIGISKSNSIVDLALLEHCLRDELNKSSKRVMVVLDPIKVVITNYPEGQVEDLEAVNNPEDESMGNRTVPFSREIYIEKSDFMENPPKKFFRLSMENEVRLKHAYYMKCEKVIKDEQTGEIIELQCSYDPETKGGWSNDGRKVRGTLQWVSAEQALDIQVNIYDHLFTKENPNEVNEGEDFLDNINSDSLKVMKSCKAEPGLKQAEPDEKFQFLRHGYFCLDEKDSTEKLPVFNRTTSLRDSWAKMQKK